MTDFARLDELLSQWQRQPPESRDALVEQLCSDSPEMLGELHRRIDMLRQMEQLANRCQVTRTARASEGDGPTQPQPATEAPLLPDLPGYEVMSRLGRGGMGVVYAARDHQLGRAVAIKMLRDGDLDPAQRRRFLTEAKATASLNHPHIVQVFGLGEHRGQPYLVMELVDGPTLQQCIAGKSQPPRDAALLIQLLAQAVHAAHERRIIHRDLKPSNVLLARPAAEAALNCAWGWPKITDFGLARLLDTADGPTRTGDVAGTPSYMAPEQALGRLDAIGPATDIYALGVMLYELLTDRPPFRSATVSAILHQLLHDDPIPPRRLQPEVPRDLETICLSCLHKEPARRYCSAQALADDLGRCLAGKPIHARPVGRLERAWKWTRRQPLVAALVAGTVVLVIAALAGLGYGWQQAEWARELEAGRADYERSERAKVEAQSYLNGILLADHDLTAGRPAWAEATLQQSPERLHQWEWFHLIHRCRHPAATVLTSHGRVSAVAVAGDGRFASADDEGTIHIWLRGANKPARTLRGHAPGSPVNWIAFTAGGDALLSGGADGQVLIWDTASGQCRNRFTSHDGSIGCIAVHPHEPWIASAVLDDKQAGEILLWNLQTQEVLHRLAGHSSGITGLAFHPDGSELASASRDRTVVRWNAATGQRLDTLRAHRLPVSCVAYSPDGTTLVSAAGRLESRSPQEDEILIWERATGTVLHRLRGHSGRAVTVAYTEDGRRLATAGWDHQIKLWDPQTGQDVLTLTGHEGLVTGLTFARDGRLISGSIDRTIRVWEAPGAAAAAP
jgi:eukaryotic-like serine/threonine-protein kinase